MKLTLIWNVLDVLIEEICNKYEEAVPSNKDRNSTSYYFLTGKERDKQPKLPTLGKAIKDAFPDLKDSIGEKSIYTYLYIPAKKRRTQVFNGKSLYPTVFLKYIGFKDVSSFLDHCEAQQLLSSYALKEQRDLLNSASGNVDSKVYKLYFYDGKRVKLGRLVIEDLRKATLLFQYNENVNLTSYQGTLNVTKDTGYLSFDRQDGLSKIFMCFNFGDNGISRNQKLVKGVYSASDKDSIPIAGKALLELDTADKVFEVGDTVEVLKNLKPEIALYLSNSFLKTSNELSNNYYNLVKTDVESAKDLIGVFESYAIDNSNGCLSKSLYEIKSDFTILCKSYPSGFFKGFVSIHSTGRIATFYLQSEVGNSSFQSTIHLDTKTTPNVYMGVFSGVSLHNFPESGRELFIKRDSISFNDGSAEKIRLNKKKYTSLVEQYPIIEKFFSGHVNTNFMEDNYTLNKISSLSTSKGWLNQFVGVYDVCFRSSDRTIRKYILQLKKDGSVNLKGKTAYTGHFQVKANNLIVNLDAIDHQEYFNQIICYLGDTPGDTKLNNMLGIVSGLSDSDAPICVRSILIRTYESYEQLTPNEYCINDIGIKDKFPLPGLYEYLRGKTENVLMIEKSVNNKELSSINYGDLYFSSICYLSSKTNVKDKIKNRRLIIKQLIEALEHGFDDFDLLKSKLVDESSGVLCLERDRIEDFLMIRFEDCHFMRNKLVSLFESIRNPINISNKAQVAIKKETISSH